MNPPGVVLVGGPLDGLELDMAPGLWKVPIYDDSPVPEPALLGNLYMVEPANPAAGRAYTWHIYQPEPYRHRIPGFRVRLRYMPAYNHPGANK